ncbi:MAG TPA: thioredoxin domain-containing protein [Pyrinomonadaceae bacterium]|nr:thioredoxin domain-containing protein [Pyrinomonadaceae bacterium]
MKRYLPFIIIGAVLAIALGAGYAFYKSAKKPVTASESLAGATPTPDPPPAGGPRVPVSQAGAPAGDSAHVRGPANARITMEEYGDYQCPSCGVLFHELKKIEQEYAGQMRFVFRHFPLPTIHKYALLSAHAAEAASRQGRFWEMHELIYTNQAAWSASSDARPIFIQYARNLGLDVDRFTRDLDDPAVAARVQADYQRGVAANVQGTPTIFLNGRQLRSEAHTPEGLRMALDFMLGKRTQ